MERLEFEEVTETYQDEPLNCVGSKAHSLQKVVSLQVPSPCDLSASQRLDEQALRKKSKIKPNEILSGNFKELKTPNSL